MYKTMGYNFTDINKDNRELISEISESRHVAIAFAQVKPKKSIISKILKRLQFLG